MLEVPPGEVVLTEEVADFQHERPSFRLYRVQDLVFTLAETPSGQRLNSHAVKNAYEARFLDTAWGALAFTVSPSAPKSAERVARHLQAVLRFWEPLQTARYLYKTLRVVHTLEELMMAACGWSLEAWCPEGATSVRALLERTAERMARATREDCIETILRQLSHALSTERGLKHRSVLTDPTFQRERLATLDPLSFERVSGAAIGYVLELVFAWDRQLGRH
jgi:hypothetical protein